MTREPPPSYERSEKHETLEPSNPTPIYTSIPIFQTHFASISLLKFDRIRLLQFPPETITGIGQIIKMHWHHGLQDQRKYSRSDEFKYLGNPWFGQAADAIPARILMREMLAYLFSQGWILHASTDISKKALDKDTMIFRKQEIAPPQSDWIAMSFNQGDRLRVIGADVQLLAAFRTMLNILNVLKEEGWKDEERNAWEFRLRGYPWRAVSGEQVMSTRLLLLRVRIGLRGVRSFMDRVSECF